MKSLVNFPQVALFHGGQDQSIPSTVCDELADVLRKGHVPVSSIIYPKMSHTDPILENVLAGETYLIDDMAQLIEEKYSLPVPAPAAAAASARESQEEKTTFLFRSQKKKQPKEETAEHEAPVMVSRKLIYFARIMNPF
jgi:dienelactone hydrolase